jgi:hypothetical protein
MTAQAEAWWGQYVGAGVTTSRMHRVNAWTCGVLGGAAQQQAALKTRIRSM